MRAGRGEAVRMGRRGVQRQSRACAQAGPLSPRASQCGLFDWQSHAVSWDSGLPQQCSRLASCRTRMPSFLSLQSLSIPVWGFDDARLSRHQHAHSSTLWQMSGCVPFPFMMLSRDSRMMIITTRQFHSDFSSPHAPAVHTLQQRSSALTGGTLCVPLPNMLANVRRRIAVPWGNTG